MNKSAWYVGFTPQLSTAVFMTKENKDGVPVSLYGTGGREMVTGGSFPAAIWTGFMKGALKKTDVENFPKPPKGALRDLDCPEILPPDAQEIPMGCPTPEITEDPFLEEATPRTWIKSTRVSSPVSSPVSSLVSKASRWMSRLPTATTL